MGLIGRLLGRQQTQSTSQASPPPAPPTSGGQETVSTSPQTGKDQVTLSPGAHALTDPTNPLYHTNGLGNTGFMVW